MVEVGFELRKVGTEMHYAVTLALAKGTLVLFQYVHCLLMHREGRHSVQFILETTCSCAQ